MVNRIFNRIQLNVSKPGFSLVVDACVVAQHTCADRHRQRGVVGDIDDAAVDAEILDRDAVVQELGIHRPVAGGRQGLGDYVKLT